MSWRDTDKYWIKDLVAIAALKGLKKVVMSPGSRCAPLVIAFDRHPDIECITIVDERSAAFFALGMAQQLREPVGLVCTSGSSTLNYAPAIAEAFYSKIPLVLFTADRPKEWIGQADGQAIQQFDIYKNYIKASYELPAAIEDKDLLWYSNRIVSEAINRSMIPDMGPVHINTPFREPLYKLKDYPDYQMPKVIEATKIKPTIKPEDESRLLDAISGYTKILMVAGSLAPDETLNKTVNLIAAKTSVVVLTEVTANLQGPDLITTLDPALEAITDKEAYQPDLLITFGGPVVSKKLKRYLRQFQPKEHWLIDESGDHTDTYQTLTNVVKLDSKDFLDMLLEKGRLQESNYQQLWDQAKATALQRHQDQLNKAPYCDLTVFDTVLKSLPNQCNLHLANSTPVRYAGLFTLDHIPGLSVNCNRGTSGIDGAVSTAAGAAYVNNEVTVVITGDLSFFYDSNALWNHHLSDKLRIIVINNGGGNIFKIIPGPASLPEEELETRFETSHNASVEYMAKAFGIPYYFCDDQDSLLQVLPEFYKGQPGQSAVLEIKTPNHISARVLKEYLNV